MEKDLPYPQSQTAARKYVELGYWTPEQREAWKEAQRRAAPRQFAALCAKYPNWAAMWAKKCADDPDYCPNGVPSGYAIPEHDYGEREPDSIWSWIVVAIIVLVIVFAVGWAISGLYLPRRDF